MDCRIFEKMMVETIIEVCKNYEDKEVRPAYDKCSAFLTHYSNLIEDYKKIGSKESLNNLNLFFATYGKILNEIGSFEESEKAFLAALSYKDDNYEDYEALIELLIKQEKTTSAEKIFHRAIKNIKDIEKLSRIENKFESKFMSKMNEVKIHKRILMGAIEIANQLYLLSNGLKKVDYETISVNYLDVIYNNTYDINLPLNKLNRIENVNELLMESYCELFNNVDLFHFHFGTTLLLDRSDLEVIIARKKPIIMHHWGSDVRQKSIAKKYSPDVEVNDGINEEYIVNTLMELSSRIKYCIVPDIELYQYVENYYSKVFILPIAIDTNKYIPQIASKGNTNKIIIGHAPTNRKVKGTDHIIKVVDKLKTKYPIELKLVEGVTNSEALKIYQQCDIIIDQVLIGRKRSVI